MSRFSAGSCNILFYFLRSCCHIWPQPAFYFWPPSLSSAGSSEIPTSLMVSLRSTSSSQAATAALATFWPDNWTEKALKSSLHVSQRKVQQIWVQQPPPVWRPCWWMLQTAPASGVRWSLWAGRSGSEVSRVNSTDRVPVRVKHWGR